MTAVLVAAAAALLASVLVTAVLIGQLRAHRIGQPIREDGPQGHFIKAGTPTMGGLGIVFAAVAAYALAHIWAPFTYRGLVVVAATCAAALVGFADDWIKVTRQRSLGLNKRAKAGGLLVVAVAFAVVSVYWLKVDTYLSFTAASSTGINLGRIGWIVFAVLVFVGSSNAVNLTDGLDGLVAGSASFNFVALTVVGFYQLRHLAIYHNPTAWDETIVSSAMMGACAGFLWWNAAPARIIMGDTGALGIGAAIAAIGLLEDIDLLLPIIAGLFVVEALSVIIQVASFRLAHRRVFRMAPIHHHFELLGWAETTVVIRFWILAGAFTALGLGFFYADFLVRGGAR